MSILETIGILIGTIIVLTILCMIFPTFGEIIISIVDAFSDLDL